MRREKRRSMDFHLGRIRGGCDSNWHVIIFQVPLIFYYFNSQKNRNCPANSSIVVVVFFRCDLKLEQYKRTKKHFKSRWSATKCAHRFEFWKYFKLSLNWQCLRPSWAEIITSKRRPQDLRPLSNCKITTSHQPLNLVNFKYEFEKKKWKL